MKPAIHLGAKMGQRRWHKCQRYKEKTGFLATPQKTTGTKPREA